MKRIHVPEINMRYWLAITFASIFGTNLGDLYAHDSGFGLLGGLWLLVALAAVTFLSERKDDRPHEVYYWLAIVIIRTGATNIADYLRHSLPAVALAGGLVALLTGLAWLSHVQAARKATVSAGVPDTDAVYWGAMLTAGVLGTVLGDDCSHLIGQGAASVALGALLVVALMLPQGGAASIGAYWTTVAIARTAGTAIGDWLAESKFLNIGLPASTALSGITFIAILILFTLGNSSDAFLLLRAQELGVGA